MSCIRMSDSCMASVYRVRNDTTSPVVLRECAHRALPPTEGKLLAPVDEVLVRPRDQRLREGDHRAFRRTLACNHDSTFLSEGGPNVFGSLLAAPIWKQMAEYMINDWRIAP